MGHSHYVIRGGVEGRERLRILARVMRPTTRSLLERVGLQPGMTCADIGCGGGDATCEIGRMVGPVGVPSASTAAEFDVVYARFLLTHLSDPASLLAQMLGLVRPGGAVVVEDVDFRGHFCHPESPVLWRYVDLYSQVVRRRGADPDIGPRLPGLLLDAGCRSVEMNVRRHDGSVA